MTREDGVAAHSSEPPNKGGSIPASSLHFWHNETDAAMDLVERFHYSERWPTNVQHITTAHLSGGLFGNKGDAVAAVVYSIPGTRWSQPVWELSRLVRHDNYRVPLSALIAASVRKLRKTDTPKCYVSFADWTHKHHGGIYQACGWHYGGLRNAGIDGVIVGGTFVPGRSANSRWGTRSINRLAARGVTAQPHWDDGKHLYWFAFGTGLETALALGLKRLPYPKPRHELPPAVDAVGLSMDLPIASTRERESS